MEKSGKNVKAHIRYFNEAKKRLPGVTTIIGVLNKPLLVPWANNLGLQGINVKDYVSDKADIGTLVHEMMFCDLSGKDVDTSYYTAVQIEIAQNSFKKYLDWKKQHTIKPIILEEGMVSERFQFGGTIDNLCSLDGVLTLIDYKTCKALYSEHFIQVTAYRQLLKEANFKVKKVAILRVGRSELEGFDFVEIPTKKLSLCWKMFKHCLGIYSLKKQLR
ncbi:PD-(D/E)XK nuclease family protein [candidate division WOR-3 bacterium]|nr:PD-(D/E)XK nuclease family protein [candidate division WOR-3 bacterium]